VLSGMPDQCSEDREAAEEGRGQGSAEVKVSGFKSVDCIFRWRLCGRGKREKG
jgi:hypothetical protein